MKRSRDYKFKLETRAKYAALNKVNFMQISICPSAQTDFEIESVETALDYYRLNGMNSVVLQPKFMGSYCDIYLFDNIENSYCVSKNGYKIDYIPHETIIEALVPIKEHVDKTFGGLYEMILIQSELMPWSALGKNLIDNEFAPYLYLHNQRKGLVCQIYEDALSLSSDPVLEKASSMLTHLSREECLKQIPHHIIKQAEATEALLKNRVPRSAYSQGLDTYQKQMRLYAQPGKLYFQPFNWLKYVPKDPEMKEVYNKSNVDGFKFTNPNYESCECNVTSVMEAKRYFQNFMIAGLEGIVVKPKRIYDGIPTVPMLKVRNPDYLHLIYGWDFSYRLDSYMSSRSIKKKLWNSAQEWNLSRMLMKIPYRSITVDNENYKKIFLARLKAEQEELSLDSRL